MGVVEGNLQDVGLRPNRWSDAGAWSGDGLRREVFFFRSGDAELYGSVYAALSPSSPVGVMLCTSWGFEGDQCSRLVHPLALAVARAGGVAATFHYPGVGDSRGDLGSVTMDALASGAVDGLLELSRRLPGTRWVLGGLMLGASVACLAADRLAAVERLMLVQPALRPGRYFARLERASRRAIGESAPSEVFAHGYPLPAPMLDSASRADAAVEAALARFAGEGVVVRHAIPATVEGAPQSFEQVAVSGAWRFGSTKLNPLLSAAGGWLRGVIGGGGDGSRQ